MGRTLKLTFMGCYNNGYTVACSLGVASFSELLNLICKQF